jgi:hypothetical protein
MAFASPVPDSGGGSGSSTATFGDTLGHIFNAMPSRQSDTSSAAENSGVDVVMPTQRDKPRRRPQGSSSASPGTRSLARATSPRNGGSPASSSSRIPPTQSRPAGSQGMNGHDPRGRAGSRTLSDTVGRLQERPSRGQLSPVGGHVESLPRDRSHYGSPSQQESAVGSPATSFAHTRVDTPVRTPHQSYTPTRLDTPSWEVKDDRWTPGRSSEKRSMDPGSLPSRSQGKRSNSPASRGEPLSYHPDHSSPAASPVEVTPSKLVQ